MKTKYLPFAAIILLCLTAGGPTTQVHQLEPAIITTQRYAPQGEDAALQINREALLQTIDRGQLLYNGQNYQATQIGNILYLPDAQRAYPIPDGYEPITLWGNAILFNPTTGGTKTVDWGTSYPAVMPSSGTAGPQIPADGGTMIPTDGGTMIPTDGGTMIPIN